MDPQDFFFKRSLLENQKSVASHIAPGDSPNTGLRFEHKLDFHDFRSGF